MQFIVCALQEAPQPAVGRLQARAVLDEQARVAIGRGDGGQAAPRPAQGQQYPLNRDDTIKAYCVDIENARLIAKQQASLHPGKQFAIFTPTEVFESVPKIIEKLISENGEVVPKEKQP